MLQILWLHNKTCRNIWEVPSAFSLPLQRAEKGKRPPQQSTLNRTECDLGLSADGDQQQRGRNENE